MHSETIGEDVDERDPHQVSSLSSLEPISAIPSISSMSADFHHPDDDIPIDPALHDLDPNHVLDNISIPNGSSFLMTEFERDIVTLLNQSALGASAALMNAAAQQKHGVSGSSIGGLGKL